MATRQLKHKPLAEQRARAIEPHRNSLGQYLKSLEASVSGARERLAAGQDLQVDLSDMQALIQQAAMANEAVMDAGTVSC